jgi:hypothetical protein
MKFKEITLANVSTEAKVETLGIVLDKELESLYGVVNSVEAMKGDKGDKGEQGIPGKDGTDGKAGVNGRDGKDGKDGVDGKDGEDGLEAPKIVDAEVALDDTLLLTLSDGTEIKTTKPVVGERGSNGSTGASGSKGDKGDAGAGIATGGTTNQVLAKASNSDYDTYWTNTPGIDLGSPDAIGDVTPNTVNATTITGQTGQLNGTGQNLLLQSNGFTTSWSNGAITLTGSQSDPVGGSTASLFVPTVANSAHFISNNTSAFSAGTQYTVSVFVKASGYTLFYISDIGAGSFACSYNLSAVTATPFTGCTGTITAVAGATGWYRVTLTTTGTPTSSSRLCLTPYPSGTTLSVFSLSFAGDGTSGAVVYGTQVEFGSTANTYIPTTTTAVYGTPILSFSGVSSIGLLSNGALYLEPAGNGAIQADATTSTAVGGNARGANAVDWQMVRSIAGQVASGFISTVSGGERNSASGAYSFIGGGYLNTATNSFASSLSGNGNTASGILSTTVGGNTNTAAGYFNFIGGGFTNSGTANAAVTTQSGTMNGTTAVTLSGSNASIRVGQLITGTSIANYTYVAAISGTSLTLSQAASGSSTSTLSFFTPHGVVVGGGNNQATGSYSFIGGGGDAGTAANRNVASGDWSFVGGGIKNLASGLGSVVCGGGTDNNIIGNTASGVASFVGGGRSNTSSGVGAMVLGGIGNTANGNYSSVNGGNYISTRSITGNIAFSSDTPLGTFVTGQTQAALLVLARQTTDATPTALCSNSSAAGTTNQVIMPNNSAYYFKGSIIANVTGAANGAAWSFEGAIMRGANAASTVLMDTPSVNRVAASSGATAWSVAITADTTNGGLRVTVTGVTGTTIRWVAKVETTEVTF